MYIQRGLEVGSKWKCCVCSYESSDATRVLTHVRVKHDIIAKKAKQSLSCRYCAKILKSFRSRIGHESVCSKHPNVKNIRLKLSASCRGKTHSEATKKKVSRSVQKRIQAGEWHNSLATHRKHHYKGEVFDGKWELGLAQWMDKHNIVWERNKRVFPYAFNDVNRSYTPDFYLPMADCYVEVKGYKTAKDNAKWSQFPLRLLILRGSDLVRMGVAVEVRDITGKYD